MRTQHTWMHAGTEVLVAAAAAAAAVRWRCPVCGALVLLLSARAASAELHCNVIKVYSCTLITFYVM